MKNLNEIKSLGLTRQREVVLRVITESHEHLTANEVFNHAKKLLPTISFATVYNSLRFLKDAGHISEVNFGGASRFDKTTSRHDHAVCSKCGKLVDMYIDLPKEIADLAAKFSNFQPDSIELTLRGLCPDCRV
jgi:Fur family transcriptional regulator, peroxide stress response regulator